MLPLGPPGGGGSPYWARSDFAGHAVMIDRDELPDLDAQARLTTRPSCAASRDWLDDYVLFEAAGRTFQLPWWQWPADLRARSARR